MLFPEEDAPLLKAWIVKRIENTSDADSDVLADYVIALLKHDGDKASVRKLCEQEIPDFLTEDSAAFLDDVFRVIQYKSYVPGAPPPPKFDPTPQAQAQQPATQENPRKRGYDDEVMQDPDALPYDGERAYKQPRRAGGRGGYGNMALPPGMPPFDPNNPMEAFMRMQSMGMGMLEQFGKQARPKRKGRCRDFDTKGFCSRGSTCMYDHGNNESSWTPPFAQGEYNPEEAMKNMAMLNQMMGYTPGHDRNGRGRGRNDRRGRGRKGGNRSGISADGPVHDRSKTTIVIENIPAENFTQDQVRDFFSQFGTVDDVTLRDKKNLAIVKYDTWESANTAYQSPKVIFDNRFVKVFWFRDEAAGESRKQPDEPELDPEEFQRRQEEAQKQYKEREAKRTELEEKRQELEKQQQELLAKHREEMERLRTKMGEPTTSSAAGTATGEDANSTDMLRAKLAELEQEAMILGINPDDDDNGHSAPPFAPRGGGYRGRARGRGSRGAYTPRGGRASFRGTGRHATYAQYSLDNRPKTVSISGVDFTTSEKDEALRHFLLNTGEFLSIDASSDATQVSFPDRKTAEKFYYSLNGNDLPGVQGKLELSWVNNPAASSAAPVVVDASASSGDKDAEGAGDAMAGMDSEKDHAHQDTSTPTAKGSGEKREVDMDYEMPDDEWAE